MAGGDGEITGGVGIGQRVMQAGLEVIRTRPAVRGGQPPRLALEAEQLAPDGCLVAQDLAGKVGDRFLATERRRSAPDFRPVVKRRSGRSPESSRPVLLLDVLAQDRDWCSSNRTGKVGIRSADKCGCPHTLS